MSTTKTVVILALVGIATVATAVYQTHRVHLSAKALAVSEQEAAILQAHLKDLEQGAKTLAAEQATLQKTLSQVQTVLTHATKPVSATQNRNQRSAALNEQFRTNPEFRRVILEGYKAEARWNCLPIFQLLGLSPGQIDQLTGLLADHFQRNIEQNLSSRNDTILTDETFQTALRGMLGDTATDQFNNEFAETMWARSFVNGIINGSYYTNKPITSQEADQLTQLVANASIGYQNGGPKRGSDLDSAAILAQLKKVLTPTQYSVAEGMTAQDKIQKLTEQAVTAASTAHASSP